MGKRIFFRLVLLLVALSLLAASGCSEERAAPGGGDAGEGPVAHADGALAGTVEASGAGLPSATVVVSPGGRPARTDRRGAFRISALTPGLYTLRVDACGYYGMTRPNVLVPAGSTAEAILSLQPLDAVPARVIGENDAVRLVPRDFGLSSGTLHGWTSEAPDVASVDPSGRLAGVRKGKAVISAVSPATGEHVSLLAAVLEEPAPFGTVNLGAPSIPAARGYVGSEACRVCHGGTYDRWKGTGHNMMVRSPHQPGLTGESLVNDADGSGVSDFVEGLDLAASPHAAPFAVFGGNAPVLGYTDDGTFSITIGPVTYPVVRTLGGNGSWRQLYLLRIGESTCISPVQFNEVPGEYALFSGDDWYDPFGEPRYRDAESVAMEIDGAGSWERRCAGCHATGLDVDFDGATGVWKAGYAHLNVGCEACHGPGAGHPGPTGSVVDPADLDKSRADDLCGACHARGCSVGVLGGETFPFPAEVDPAGVFAGFRPGDDLRDLFTFTAEPGDAWGAGRIWRGAHGGDPAPYETFVAARTNRQQLIDYRESLHATGAHAGSVTCTSCHDPHGSDRPRQIVAERVASDPPGSGCGDPRPGVAVETRTEDNSLCLACHAGFGPFGALCKDDVNHDPEGVAGAVKGHMGAEVLMGEAAYDPVVSGLGRCTGCHMPRTAVSAVAAPDGDDKTRGDLASHTFEVIWPSVNPRIDEGMPNSCSPCHSAFDPSPGTQAALQWARGGHADVTPEHWRYAAGPDRTACVRCHSGRGFADFLAGVPEADLDTTPKIHSCFTCHEPMEGVSARRRPVDTVVFPSGFETSEGGDSRLCLSCHQGRGWKGDVVAAVGLSHGDFNARTLDPHYLTAGALLHGSAASGGYEYAGRPYAGEHPHGELSCVACHMSVTPGEDDLGGHTLRMAHQGRLNRALCLGCHGSLETFEDFRVGHEDWDGDGEVEGTAREVEGLLESLLAEIETRGITRTAVFPYWSPATGEAWDGPDGARLKKAAYNYAFVTRDPGAYVHNGKYAAQLLRDAVEDLTGGPLPGVRP